MNIFKQFYKSLYSPRDIASFRLQGIGKTILYVFLLTLLSVVPTLYYINTTISETVQLTKETIKEELPDFTIENGELHSSKNAPITINKGNFAIIFDSTGAMDAGTISKHGDTLAILKHEIVLNSAGESNTLPYSMMAIDTITSQDISAFLDSSESAMAIILPFLSLTIFLFSSGLKFIEVSILALVGLLLKNFVGKNLAYRHIWRMTAYSVTLSTVFFMVMDLIKTTVPNGFLINWFVSLIILLLAIKEIPSTKKPGVTEIE